MIKNWRKKQKEFVRCGKTQKSRNNQPATNNKQFKNERERQGTLLKHLQASQHIFIHRKTNKKQDLEKY